MKLGIMKHFRSLLLISLIENTAAQTEICVPGGRCFKLYATTKTWDAAYESCKSTGQTFATIDSLEEHNAIWNSKTSGGCSSSVYFNIRQYGGPGSSWQYKDNAGNLHPYPSYTNWDGGQPQVNTEHCATLMGGDGRWHDVPCSASYCFVCTDSNASGGGDPHFSAFGGLAFTWQGHCDVVLTKIPTTKTNSGIDIHIRTTKVRKWSSIDVIAMKVGPEVVEVRSDGGNLLLNGAAVEAVENDSLSVKKSMVKKKIIIYDFVFEGDKKLQVKVNSRTRMIFVSLSGNYPKETVGLLGSPHHPGMFARDGTKMTEKEVNAYAESWQVREDDPPLFITPREPKYPAKCWYSMEEVKRSSRRLKETHKASMVEAIAACASHNSGPLKDFCIQDMIETGDFDSAQDEFYG